MLENNNQEIVRKMARKNIQGNPRRNGILVAAVALAAFMLITVLTVGITYFESLKKQTIRMYGGEHDAVLMGPRDEQIEQCKKDSRMKDVGVMVKCASAKSNGVDDSLHTKFIWSDETYWGVQKRPALKWVKGKYPQAENELMISTAALEECGSRGMSIGSRFTLTYADYYGEHTKEFVVSGIYQDHWNETKAYVSRSFYETTGHKPSDITSGEMFLTFSDNIFSDKQLDRFREELNLGKQQRLFYTGQTEQSIPIFFGILGLIFVTCACSYLLVYNILYLSLVNNIRYYGLLQTVGMTGRQVRGLLYHQMFFLGGLGILLGLGIGSGTAFLIIPRVVKAIGIKGGAVSVSFHPAVYIAAVVIICLTIYTGSRKPAKIAGQISPVEATGYSPVKIRQVKRKTGRGSILTRMARTNLLKDKKRSGIVILSLSLSISIFICVVTIIQSQGARNIVKNFMGSDLTLTNDSLSKEDESKHQQIFDEKFVEKLEAVQGVKKVQSLYLKEITVPWEADFAETWMREMYATWMEYPYEEAIDEYKLHPEKFYSYIVGIDEKMLEELNKNLEKPVDKKAFTDGEICVIYRNDMELSEKEIEGKQITFHLKDQGAQESHTLPIAALTNDRYYSPLNGLAATVIVSSGYLHRLEPKPYRQKLEITFDEEYDKATESRVLEAVEESPYYSDIDISSKIDSMENIKESQGRMMEFGVGIVIILALIGIMNYVNTVSSNIQNRLGELAVLESIGMTKNQMKKMLVREGLLFAGISLILSSTLGVGATYVIYQSVNYLRVGFYFPFLPVLGVYLLVIVVCIGIPLILYHYIVRGKSSIERLREAR